MKSSTTDPKSQPSTAPRDAEPKSTAGGDIKIAALDFRESGDRVIVRFREFNGRHYVDIRIHARTQDGETIPTPKGISVRVDEVFNLHDAIGKACDLAKTVRR